MFQFGVSLKLGTKWYNTDQIVHSHLTYVWQCMHIKKYLNNLKCLFEPPLKI